MLPTHLAPRSPWPALAAAAGFAALGIAHYRSSRPRSSMHDDVVVITGGSRGLGLLLAQECRRRGAKVAIVARDHDELMRATESLGTRWVLPIVADLRNAADVERVIHVVARTFGRLDVLINNAGVILSAPFEDTSEDDFRKLMDVHLWAPLRLTKAALPLLTRSGRGRLVNISSIGGRLPVPHLSAYCASKFALAGLSSVLRAELAPLGVKVVTVYPGLMRTGSHVNARFKGDVEREYALFSLAASLPLASMNAERAARLIIDAVVRGQSVLTMPAYAKAASVAWGLIPEVVSAALTVANRLLPEGGNGGERRGVAGHELAHGPVVRAATALGARAAARHNETLAKRLD